MKARAATAAEQSKAKRLRALPSLNREQRIWLTRYQEAHPVRKPPRKRPPAPAPARAEKEAAGTVQAPAPTQAQAPAEVQAPAPAGAAYEAPPAVTLDQGHELADLRDLDAVTPEPVAPAEPPSIAPLTDHDRDPSQPCGVCSHCRSKVKPPICPESGQVIPRPLDARSADAAAMALLGTIGFGVAAMYQSIIDPPSAQQRADTASALAQLSERYDLAMVNELAPYLMLVRGAGTYTKDAFAQGKTRKAAKARIKAAAAGFEPTRIVT